MPLGRNRQGREGFAVMLAVAAGTAAAPFAVLVSGVIVEVSVPGAVSFEMGFLVAVFVAGLCGFVAGWPSALLGAFCRLVPNWTTGSAVALAGLLMGALLGGCVSFWIIAPRATVPPPNVFWVGVVTTLGSATAGAVAGVTSWLTLCAIDRRRASS